MTAASFTRKETESQGLALERDGLAGAQCVHPGHATGRDVIGENGHEISPALRAQKVLNGARGQAGRGVIGWGEDSQWALAAQGLSESCGLRGGDESFERPGLLGDLEQSGQGGGLSPGRSREQQDHASKTGMFSDDCLEVDFQ